MVIWSRFNLDRSISLIALAAKTSLLHQQFTPRVGIQSTCSCGLWYGNPTPQKQLCMIHCAWYLMLYQLSSTSPILLNRSKKDQRCVWYCLVLFWFCLVLFSMCVIMFGTILNIFNIVSYEFYVSYESDRLCLVLFWFCSIMFATVMNMSCTA